MTDAMAGAGLAASGEDERGAGRCTAWLKSPGDATLAGLIGGRPHVVSTATAGLPPGSQEVVVAPFRLQHLADYRGAIQVWFAAVRIGGRLVIAVPHAFLHDRQLALPSRRDPAARRLYTPRVLLDEVEETLAPNSYRVRYLADDDRGYDYAAAAEVEPVGAGDIVLVLERIAEPGWQPALTGDAPAVRPLPVAPDYAFSPPSTRVEVERRTSPRRVLLLKPDHLGDFIMALPALERARALFADAELTLLCGSWNADMARELGLADRIVPFDVFPRNSTEEEPDVAAKGDLFRTAVPDEYDLAIDLRIDYDVRPLLRLVRAGLRAGIGTRARFPFLDIFLPVDGTRNEPETAREDRLTIHDFPTQGSTVRSRHRVFSAGATAERDCAIVWGPYWHLRSGQYIFEPHLEIDPRTPGLLMLDVAVEAQRVAQVYVDRQGEFRLPFTVETPGRFEFRVWTVDGEPAPDLNFYGGRLIRAGAASVLHQSEYMLLLIELVAMRLARTGLLSDLATA